MQSNQAPTFVILNLLSANISQNYIHSLLNSLWCINCTNLPQILIQQICENKTPFSCPPLASQPEKFAPLLMLTTFSSLACVHNAVWNCNIFLVCCLALNSTCLYLSIALQFKDAACQPSWLVLDYNLILQPLIQIWSFLAPKNSMAAASTPA